jgi:hypothetical protein
MLEYAALVASPRALSDGLILVFQHPANEMSKRFNVSPCNKFDPKKRDSPGARHPAPFGLNSHIRVPDRCCPVFTIQEHRSQDRRTGPGSIRAFQVLHYGRA